MRQSLVYLRDAVVMIVVTLGMVGAVVPFAVTPPALGVAKVLSQTKFLVNSYKPTKIENIGDTINLVNGNKLSSVGELGSDKPLLCEVDGEKIQGPKHFVVIVQPGKVMWVKYFDQVKCIWIELRNLQNAINIISSQIAAIFGIEPVIINLPNKHFAYLVCLQSTPITASGIVTCDKVGHVGVTTINLKIPSIAGY